MVLPTTSHTALNLSLTYEGKRPEQDILATQPASLHTLWEGPSQQRVAQNTNFLYYGDNKPILASLLQDPTICGHVRLVYIDPPFATNSVFQSRSQGDAYCDLLVGAHYIEFMRERLILLRELLSDDGSIYVHLDENMAFHIKIIMDEIFGHGNFRNWITRKKCNPKNYTRKTYGNVSDYILFYTKSNNYVWDRSFIPWTDESSTKEYQYIEKETGLRYKKVPVHAPGVRNGATGKEWKGKLPPPGKHWQYPPEVLDEMDARGEIYWSPTGNPRRKIYLEASEGIPVQDIWMDFKDAHNQNIHITGYPTEKNPDLLARIIEASSHPGDLVLDCFAGSGTTLAVASKLKRRWLGIDNSTEAISTIFRRFAKGLEPMGDFVNQENASPSQEPFKYVENLWTVLDGTKEQLRKPLNVPDVIDDFVLCSVADSTDDLSGILPQWLEWQKEAS
ncbi:MAG: site-specific DNA-methyltransferase, partial [Ktedonobacteraceae bacterium]